ncbi:MAG: RDD family protein [Steroidobacteraceae bacterium]
MSASIDTILTAETPEGIAIVIRPAGFAVRCTAFLIDVFIRFFILSSLGTALAVAGRFANGAMFIILFVVNWLYPVIFELTPLAATPGKHMMGLQVMMANGLPITPAGCLTRNLMRAVDMLPLMYAFAIVTMLLRRDARRLGDLAGGTVVAYRHEAAVAGAFGQADPMPPPVALSPRQQAAIAAFAWRVDRLTRERAEEIAALAGSAAPLRSTSLSMTARLVGIARWLHGQRPRPVSA